MRHLWFGQFLDGHPQIAERIRTCGPKPISAFDEAHRHKTAVRSDWSQVHVSKVCPLPSSRTPSPHAPLPSLCPSLLDGNSVETQVYTTPRFEADAPQYGRRRTRRGMSISFPRSCTSSQKDGFLPLLFSCHKQRIRHGTGSGESARTERGTTN